MATGSYFFDTPPYLIVESVLTRAAAIGFFVSGIQKSCQREGVYEREGVPPSSSKEWFASLKIATQRAGRKVKYLYFPWLAGATTSWDSCDYQTLTLKVVQ